MKASELRLGNWVQTKKYQTKVIVKHIYSEHMIGCGDLNDDYDEFDPMIEDIEPIPLTEEWLVKFGFEYKEMYYQSKYLVALNDCFIIAERVTGLFYVDAPNNELKHVHQLQNLYFALTGKELTIKD